MKKAKTRQPQAARSVSTRPCRFDWHLLIEDGLFYCGVYLYLWLAVGTHFIFHGAGLISNFPAFYMTQDFLEQTLFQLGGAALYTSAFLSQLFYHAWLGAMVVTVQAWLLGLCLVYLLKASGANLWRWIRFVPAYLLLAAYSQYLYYVPTTVALLLALLCACVYVYGALRVAGLGRAALFLILSGLCYAATGGAFLVFVGVCALYELWGGRRPVPACVCALIGSGVPYGLGVLVGGVDTAEAYTRLLPISWTLQSFDSRSLHIELVYALYLLVPCLMVAGRYWPWHGPAFLKSHVGVRSIGVMVLSAAIGAGVVFVSFDTERRDQFAVDYYAAHRMWPQAMQTARKLSGNEYAMHAVDRGLYHTGRLGKDLFKWAQTPDFLFLENTAHKRVFWATYAVAMEMGLLNQAEHALTECLEGLGDRPIVLEHLALINMAKGNVGTARVYLGALSKTLFHHTWACESLAHIKSDPNLTSDRDVQYLRSVALDQDMPTVNHTPNEMMRLLLKKNPRNRMAFEYLMTYDMLNHELVQLAESIGLAANMGYTALPTHFEEAALVYVYTKKKPLRLEGMTPDARLSQRIKQFSQILARHQGNTAAARPELAKSFGDTYFFYNIYGPKPRPSTAVVP
jgi:hypothetical protein